MKTRNTPKIQGKPCKRRHSGLRYVNKASGKPGHCIECTQLTAARRRAANPQRHKAASAAWRAQNPEKANTETSRQRAREQSRTRYAANPEKVKADSAAWYAANTARAKANVVARRAANPEKHRAANAKRRSLKQLQRCVCCKDADFLFLFDTDWVSKDMGYESCHVDHIVQLAMGGAHCVKNLRILIEAEHKVKNRADAKQRAGFRMRARLLKAWAAPSIEVPEGAPFVAGRADVRLLPYWPVSNQISPESLH